MCVCTVSRFYSCTFTLHLSHLADALIQSDLQIGVQDTTDIKQYSDIVTLRALSNFTMRIIRFQLE
jgi:hypothetical protein